MILHDAKSAAGTASALGRLGINTRRMKPVALLAIAISAATAPSFAIAETPAERTLAAASQAPDLKFPDTPSPLPAIPKTSLYKPNGAGPFPALVLHHQCGGLARGKWQNKSILEWVKQGVNRGYVVLLIDSLGPRNVETLCMGAKNGVNLARGARDALQGAEHLRKFDFVDKKRIAHAGYSWGGMLGLLANTKAYQFALRLDGFGAHVSFYPGCFMIPATAPFEIVRPDIIRPHLILMAEKDNETPADECVRKLSDVKGKGAPVEWHVYLGATHCWDCENLNNVSKVDNRGNRVTYKYDAKATADSAKRMFEFLDRTWRASGS